MSHFKRLLYENLSFARHLGRYRRQHVLEVSKLYSPRHAETELYITRNLKIVAPDRAVTFQEWRNHTYTREGSLELAMFLNLRRGCERLLDIGAAEGIMSALFAVTSFKPSGILAVDAIPAICRIHAETIERNRALCAHPVDWRILNAVILSDSGTDRKLDDGVFGDTFTNSPYIPEGGITVRSYTLRELSEREGFVPDIIKMDIESFEYEVLTSSGDYLARHRPRLHLELHSEMMRKRGKNPDEALDLLMSSHRVVHSIPSNYRSAPLSRIAFEPKLDPVSA